MTRSTWDLWLPHSAIAGALVGICVWLLWAPRARVGRASIVLVTINCAAWTNFLLVTPRMSQREFQSIEAERAARDQASGLDLIDHWTRTVAARPLGIYGGGGFANHLLDLMAGPAILVVEMEAVPAHYYGIQPNESESYWIAGIGFVLSCAWWSAVGEASAVIARLRKRRR